MKVNFKRGWGEESLLLLLINMSRPGNARWASPATAMENRAHLLLLPDKGQLAERGEEDSCNSWGLEKDWTFQLSRLDGNCPMGAPTPTVTVPGAFSGHRQCCPCCWFCCLCGVSEAGRRSTWWSRPCRGCRIKPGNRNRDDRTCSTSGSPAPSQVLGPRSGVPEEDRKELIARSALL